MYGVGVRVCVIGWWSSTFIRIGDANAWDGDFVPTRGRIVPDKYPVCRIGNSSGRQSYDRTGR